ncbi:MAG: hypothetical protein Q4D16_26190 [Eubacteriales bacterium]|nr:hypothetical protein [Eubacteriales bacterium]
MFILRKEVSLLVRNRTLLLIASLVWLTAGFNIVRIGFIAYTGKVSMINLLCSAATFTVFWFMVFKRLVIKHTARIKKYKKEKQYFWNFFDLKSFCIMAFMMTFGITIRVFSLMPDTFIAVFYTGLGIALALAGVKFAANYVQYDIV